MSVVTHVLSGEVLEVIPPRTLRISVIDNGKSLLCNSVLTTFNAKEGRTFASGDIVHVHLVEKDTIATEGEISVCLTSEYVKPLLVLDINGVLGARGAYQPRQHKRSFYPRPHLDSFLSFCLNHFEVGVWSCALRKNIEVSIFPENSLLFIYDSSHSTNLWPRRSIVSDAKPLFLKELSSIWSSYPCYSSSNTVLLDNHIEKFERNPVGTCLILPEYSVKHGSSDEYLSSAGELVHHLSALSTCGDTRRYILAHSGTSLLFPTEHTSITPPLPNATPNADTTTSKPQRHDSNNKRAASRGNNVKDHQGSGMWRRGEQVPTVSPSAPTTTGTSSELLLHYLTLSWGHRIPAAKLQSEFLSKQVLPAPRAIPLRRCQLPQLANSFAVCEKTDGERCILVISSKYQAVYTVDRALHVHTYTASTNSILSGESVFDGEMVWNQSLGCMVYMIFDSIVINDNIIGNHNNLYARIEAAQQYILSVPPEVPLVLNCKQLLPIAQTTEVVANMKVNENGFVYTSSDGSTHASDGLLFTPASTSYFDTLCYKWKPVHLTTIDFAVKVSDISKHLQHNKHRGNGSSSNTITGYSSSGHNMLPISTIHLSARDKPLLSGLLATGSSSSSREEYAVVECKFSNSGVWELYKHRPERVTPNSVRTAWNNLECIAESLHMDELLSTLCTTTQTTDNQSVENSSISDVASHYDRLQIGRNEGDIGSDGRIALLRRLNNWAKACMIKHITSASNCNMLYDVLSTPSIMAAHPSVLTRPTGAASRRSAKHATRTPIRVADIGCGRGGDINKWTANNKITLYFGIDPSQESIIEAKKRAAELQKRRRLQHYSFHVLSAIDTAVSRTLEVELEKQSAIGVDVMWCQFALHYFCSSGENLRTAMTTISSHLRTGGIFCCTYLNPSIVLQHMQNTSCEDNRLFDIKPVSDRVSYTGTCTSTNDAANSCTGCPYCIDFGNCYRFSMADAVEDCEEYIVPTSQLQVIAESLGLRLITQCSLGDYMLACSSDDELMQIRQVLKVIGQYSPNRDVSTQEWEAIQLYVVAMWEKK